MLLHEAEALAARPLSSSVDCGQAGRRNVDGSEVRGEWTG